MSTAATADADGNNRPDDSEREAAGIGASGSLSRSMMERWKMDNAPARARLLLRALAWLFSLLSLIVMASNKHGDGQDFDDFPEYNYCLGISVIAFLYTMAQVLREVHGLSYGRDVIVARNASAIIDFAGDQVIAYLLISALSAAAPVTDYMRQVADNLFTDSAGASISMTFFAFLAMGLSAVISGYKLSLEALV